MNTNIFFYFLLQPQFDNKKTDPIRQATKRSFEPKAKNDAKIVLNMKKPKLTREARNRRLISVPELDEDLVLKVKKPKLTRDIVKRRLTPTVEYHDDVWGPKRVKYATHLPDVREQLAPISSSAENDSQFINCLLDSLFTSTELRSSSYYGNPSNYNGKCHFALDVLKLEYINRKSNIYSSLETVKTKGAYCWYFQAFSKIV